MYYIIFIVLILIACVLLILTVLAQSPKGGMAANFGVSNQVMGVRETTNFLEKFTWGLVASIVVLCIAATMSMPGENVANSYNKLEQSILDANAKSSGNEGLNQPITLPGTGTEEGADAAGTTGGETTGETAATPQEGETATTPQE